MAGPAGPGAAADVAKHALQAQTGADADADADANADAGISAYSGRDVRGVRAAALADNGGENARRDAAPATRARPRGGAVAVAAARAIALCAAARGRVAARAVRAARVVRLAGITI